MSKTNTIHERAKKYRRDLADCSMTFEIDNFKEGVKFEDSRKYRVASIAMILAAYLIETHDNRECVGDAVQEVVNTAMDAWKNNLLARQEQPSASNPSMN